MRRDRSDEANLSADALRMRTAIDRRLFPADRTVPWYRRRPKLRRWIRGDAPKVRVGDPRGRWVLACTVVLAFAALLAWMVLAR